MYKGIILGFRKGPKTQNPNQVLVRVPDLDGEGVRKIIGYTVEYVDKYGNRYIGTVIRHHGSNNVVRVVFKPNLPGQAIGDRVIIKPLEAQQTSS